MYALFHFYLRQSWNHVTLTHFLKSTFPKAATKFMSNLPLLSILFLPVFVKYLTISCHAEIKFYILLILFLQSGDTSAEGGGIKKKKKSVIQVKWEEWKPREEERLFQSLPRDIKEFRCWSTLAKGIGTRKG